MTAVSPAAPRRPLHPLLAWPLAALLYALTLTAAALWGLKAAEHGFDSRARDLLICYALGAPLGLLALAPVYRYLLPRGRPLLRYGLAFVLVAGASTAGIALLAFLATTPLSEIFRPDISLLTRLLSPIAAYALEVFLFLTLGQRIAMPQALPILIAAAWWLGDRRARIP
jgi:hypothetical protein